MKLRKIKLISSFISLAMVCAVLTIGVWAAASQSVNVRTTITFTATAVSGTIFATLTGLDKTTYFYNTTMDANGAEIVFSPKTEALGDWILGTDQALKINNTDGLAADMLYTFTITNSSTTDAMNAKISEIAVGTNLTMTSIVQDDTLVTATDDAYILTPITAGATSVIAVLFNVIDEASSIASADISYNLALTNPNAETEDSGTEPTEPEVTEPETNNEDPTE